MKSNRSIPRVTVIPVLIYLDVREAVDWLCEAFGFTERLQIGEGHRSQLYVGKDGAVIVREIQDNRKFSQRDKAAYEVMVRIENVKAHCEHARQCGAQILSEPTDYMYGERQYTAEDLAGYRWTFTESVKDVDPAEWGGILKTE
jgi:uncharacterized glyoxalase superfamily protein PhnB